MKRILRNLIANACVASLLAVVSLPTAAQPPRDPETAAKYQTEWMQRELSLTEAQLPKVQELNLTYAKKQRALLAGKEADRTQRRADWKALQQEKETQVKTLLTEAQWKLYEQKKQERSHGRPHHRGRSAR
jgi:hypothetical protein